MTVSNNDILKLNQTLNELSPKSVSIKGLEALLDLKEELQQPVADFVKAQKDIFAQYEIKEDNQGLFRWTEHPQEAEITEKINELYNTEVELKLTNQISKDDFFAATKTLTLGPISFLRKYLPK